MILEVIIAAGHQQGDERLRSIYMISDKLDLLKVLLRLAHDIRAIDESQYLAVQKIIQEIGKMVGGWIKSVLH
jgi:hypothetical protein